MCGKNEIVPFGFCFNSQIKVNNTPLHNGMKLFKNGILELLESLREEGYNPRAYNL